MRIAGGIAFKIFRIKNTFTIELACIQKNKNVRHSKYAQKNE